MTRRSKGLRMPTKSLKNKRSQGFSLQSTKSTGFEMRKMKLVRFSTRTNKHKKNGISVQNLCSTIAPGKKEAKKAIIAAVRAENDSDDVKKAEIDEMED
mmetsp:Transcript_18828/g.63625  ORF Transcript_18828/g.63625 Transcript_18828/m.63625 type:complete len:99 (+) Transcript_18828:53-349(+)